MGWQQALFEPFLGGGGVIQNLWQLVEVATDTAAVAAAAAAASGAAAAQLALALHKALVFVAYKFSKWLQGVSNSIFCSVYVYPFNYSCSRGHGKIKFRFTTQVEQRTSSVCLQVGLEMVCMSAGNKLLEGLLPIPPQDRTCHTSASVEIHSIP